VKDSRKTTIAEYINRFYYEHDKVPSVREIEKGTPGSPPDQLNTLE
jgi:hypothetical protein